MFFSFLFQFFMLFYQCLSYFLFFLIVQFCFFRFYLNIWLLFVKEVMIPSKLQPFRTNWNEPEQPRATPKTTLNRQNNLFLCCPVQNGHSMWRANRLNMEINSESAFLTPFFGENLVSR